MTRFTAHHAPASRRRPLAAVVTVALAVVLLNGCGSSGSGAAPTEITPESAACKIYTAYLKRATANVEGTFDDVTELPEVLSKLRGKVTADLEEKLELAIPYFQQLEALRYDPRGLAALKEAPGSSEAGLAGWQVGEVLNAKCELEGLVPTEGD